MVFALAIAALFFTSFNLYRLALVVVYFRRHRVPLAPALTAHPRVTVQIPVYNDPLVVERALRAASALDYPRDAFEIQLLDDSDDETTAIARKVIAELRDKGTFLRHLRRAHRTGFKGGALAEGTALADGEFLAVFDSDFVPPPDFLKRTIPFFEKSNLAVVQAKWSFLNEGSLGTRLQAIYLNAHFILEHTARWLSGGFFHFNGTAGVWRKRAVEDAGGWSGETLTEDLDLSYRAHLRGWEFLFLEKLEVPSELPADLKSFRRQQFRWVKGMVQVAKKLLPEIWRTPTGLWQKIDATFHLTSPLSYPMGFLAFIGVFAGGWIVPVNLIWVLIYFGIAEHLNGTLRARRWLDILMIVPWGVLWCWNGTHALISGWLSSTGVFERTPKTGIVCEA